MIMLMNGIESLDNMQIGSTEIITDTLYLSWTFIKHQSYEDKMSEKQHLCAKSTGCIDGSKNDTNNWFNIDPQDGRK